MHISRVKLTTLLVTASAAVAVSAASPFDAAPLPFFYDLYTFRGNDGGTAVISSFAVEAGRLSSERADGRTRFSLTPVLADTVRRTVTKTHDTVFVEVQRR